MKQGLVFLLLFNACLLAAQSKYVVYYDYGKSKPKEGEAEKLQKWLRQFNPIDIDSMQVIGFADSTGRIKNNLILSEKRAESARKIIADQFSEKLPVRIIPKGEKNKTIEERDRRVEIKVFTVRKSESVTVDSTISDTVKRCYLVDYYLLQCCHISEVTVKNKPYIKLEIEIGDLRSRKKIKHFSMSVDDSGKVTLKKLKWVSKNSGSLWWDRPRYETLIPLSDFRLHKVVVIVGGGARCDSCYRDPVINAMFRHDSCLAQDIFLNANLQYKLGFLKFKSVRIRVPSMYVDSNVAYFKDFNRHSKIYWESKRRRQGLYYYTKLNLFKDRHSYRFHPISKLMLCCWLKTYDGGGFRCGGVRYIPSGAVIGIEAGNNRFLKTNVPYVGLTYSVFGERSVTRALVAIDTGFKLNGSIRYQYSFFSLPAAFFSPFQLWHKPGIWGSGFAEINAYGGLELRAYRYREHQIFIEQNTHIGLRYYRRKFSIFSQYGYAINLTNALTKRAYPIFQTGLEFYF